MIACSTYKPFQQQKFNRNTSLVRLIAMVIVILIPSNLLNAKESLPIVEAITEDAFILSYEKDNGEIGGYAVELLKAVMADAGIEYTLDILPWARTYTRVKNEKNTIAFPVGWTRERATQFRWIAEIMPIDYSLYVLTKDKPDVPLSLEALKKMLIVVPRSDIRAEYLQKRNFTNLLLTSSNSQLTKLIKYERISYFLSSQVGLNQLIIENSMKPSEFTKVLTFDELQTRLYIVLSLQADEIIVNKITKSYQNILDNGTYLKIMGPLFETLKLNTYDKTLNSMVIKPINN